MSVLVGYVPSAFGEAALTAALAEAQRRREPLVVVNMSRDDVLADAHRASEEILDRLGRDLERSGGEFRIERIEQGNDPAEAILAAAERHRASVVVIGIRRRTAVGKFLLGSTAQRILLDSQCPVLAVKPD